MLPIPVSQAREAILEQRLIDANTLNMSGSNSWDALFLPPNQHGKELPYESNLAGFFKEKPTLEYVASRQEIGMIVPILPAGEFVLGRTAAAVPIGKTGEYYSRAWDVRYAVEKFKETDIYARLRMFMERKGFIEEPDIENYGYNNVCKALASVIKELKLFTLYNYKNIKGDAKGFKTTEKSIMLHAIVHELVHLFDKNNELSEEDVEYLIAEFFKQLEGEEPSAFYQDNNWHSPRDRGKFSELKRIAKTRAEASAKIKSEKIQSIGELVEELVGEGMTVEEAEQYARKHFDEYASEYEKSGYGKGPKGEERRPESEGGKKDKNPKKSDKNGKREGNEAEGDEAEGDEAEEKAADTAKGGDEKTAECGDKTSETGSD